MAKQWTRNYDNLFSITFGKEPVAISKEVTSPSHEEPVLRMAGLGTYFVPYTENGIMMNDIASVLRIPKPYRYGFSQYRSSSSSSVYSKSDNVGIQLGSDNTTPIYDGYVLNSPITANMTLGTVSTTGDYDPDTHIYTRTYKIPILYSGSDAVTVKEFGIFVDICQPYYIDNPTNGKYTDCSLLVYHETLDEPVTLEQNDTIEITFSQSIMQPNYTDYPTTE